MEAQLVHQLIAGLMLWAIVGLGSSCVGLYASRGDYWRGFWFMTGMWALVDGGLAWSALVGTPGKAADLSPILLFNAGLDVIYLIAAIVLMTRKTPRLRGFGLAVLFQGLFLLGFDLYFWWRCGLILGPKS